MLHLIFSFPGHSSGLVGVLDFSTLEHMALYSPSRSLAFNRPYRQPDGLPTVGRSDFRSGREALFALATHLCPQGGLVLLPVWVAEGVFLPFQLAQWEIVFYNVNHNADPVWEEIENFLKDKHFDLVVLLHFFGQQRDAQKLAGLLPESTQLLEDWAHSYPYTDWKPASEKSWCVFSPNKIVGTTDGAWLIGPEKLTISTTINKSAGNSYLFWRFLYLLGSTCIQKKIPGQTLWQRLAGGSYARSYLYLCRLTSRPAPISRLGRWLIAHQAHAGLVRKRREQAIYYFEHLRNPQIKAILTSKPGQSPLIGFPVWVENREDFIAFLNQYSIRGQVFTEKWWFAPQEATERFATAHGIYKHHFLLPINQSLSLDDIAYITKIVNQYSRNR